jgi:release factor glutamine methyltransferase
VRSSPHTRAAVVDRLIAAGCVAAGDEAEELMAAAPDATTLETFLLRREQGEPLAWITGSTGFCGHTVNVDQGVYVPRAQSEELARRAASLLAARRDRPRAADLCTGSGAVAVHLMAVVPDANVVAVDLDVRSVVCAQRNGVAAIAGDLGRPLAREAFDVVTAVAPYVPTPALPLLPADVLRYEPLLALDGGSDGLALVRRLVACAAELLRPGGWLLTEVGGDQDRRLAHTLVERGFGAVASWVDEDGELRGLVAQLS